MESLILGLHVCKMDPGFYAMSRKGRAMPAGSGWLQMAAMRTEGLRDPRRLAQGRDVVGKLEPDPPGLKAQLPRFLAVWLWAGQ